MEFKSTKPIGLMAVVTDEVAGTVEAVKVDTLRLLLFAINYCPGAAVGTDQGNMQIAYAWGGYDSKGKFHTDNHRLASNRTISSDVPNEKELWAAVAFDAIGNPLPTGHGLDFHRKLMIETSLLGRPLIHWIVEGGWQLQELELSHNPGVKCDACKGTGRLPGGTNQVVYSKKKA
jgi:hypothetical protein